MAAKCLLFAGMVVIYAFTALAEEGNTTGSYQVAKYDDRSQYPQGKLDILPLVKVKERFDYYDIDGLTPADLRAEMKRKGTKWDDGKVYAALTSWDLNYDYDITSVGGRYYLSSIKSDVDIVVTLPRLVHSAKPSQQLALSWSSYIENLTLHELGHRDIAVDIAQEIYRTLASIGSSASRYQLDAEARKQVKEKLKRLKQAQVEYDVETHHGKSQGAVLR